ncbi:TetR/AcrR family transcriptional regulator [Sphingobacterium sp. DR205]|uniref:TetR/AcrR family transcriptional regulator n=1 Tax=Sphingobacterium sp. DR205 TaxID=2713573 RepID=UPI0013E44004|nr:TetR/AcrR family transcriptional regulator [Sphingobacterium sp. DR205]QIH33822.1 TetR/AcrR family transcriptional regulator [Sphingobacterium sp. DR205]
MKIMEGEKVEKKTKIVETALRLFSEQGLQQTSMAQLSKESGVAVGTMYLHFKSKDELVEGLFLHIQESFGKAIDLSDAEMKASYKDRFFILGRKVHHYYVNNPTHFFVVNTLNYSPYISKEITELGRTHYQQSVDIMAEGLENGSFKPINIILLIRFIYNAVIALVQVQLKDNIEVTEHMIDQNIERIWKAIS